MSGDNTAYDSGSENFQKNFSGSDSSGNTDETCPICCSPLLLGEETVICSDCQTAYHKECWEENHGCAVYGCRSAPDKNVSEEFNDLKKTGMQCCSRCQTLLREEMRFCPVCGQQVNLVSVSDFFLFRIGQDASSTVFLFVLGDDPQIFRTDDQRKSGKHLLRYFGVQLVGGDQRFGFGVEDDSIDLRTRKLGKNWNDHQSRYGDGEIGDPPVGHVAAQ